MRASDLTEVIEVELRNYPFPWSKGIFQDCVKAGYTCQVLRLEGAVIGYAVLQVAADEAHLLNICIDKSYNHKGYARSLLEKMLLLAERQGAHTVFLEVRPSNPRAITMYDLAGFNEVGIRKNYYDTHGGREDAIVMAKNL